MPSRYRNSLSDFNEVATAARGGNPQALRAMTDEIFDRFVSVELPREHSLRDRLFRAESEFRAGRHPAISEDSAVAAFNEVVVLVSGPEWARTNKSQLHVFRLALKPNIPQLVGRERAQRRLLDISDRMSPSEALLATLYLGQGKLSTPEYQVAPDEWVARVREARVLSRSVPRGTRPATARLSFNTDTEQLSMFRRSVEAGLRDEASSVSTQAHVFFDRLGIAR